MARGARHGSEARSGDIARNEVAWHLRVVRHDGLSRTSRQRRTWLAFAALAAVVAVGLFAVVAAHVKLTQNQFRLDRLQSRVAAEAAQQQRLLLQAATLQSPARIVQTAQQQLGMVVPANVTYLEPVQPTAEAGKAPAEPAARAPKGASRAAGKHRPHSAVAASGGAG